MKRKRLKKLLMAVPVIERDKAEELSRINVHSFKMLIAAVAKRDIQRAKERGGGKE